MTKAEIIKSYLTAEVIEALANGAGRRTLARKIVAENPGIWIGDRDTQIDWVRTAIRRLVGVTKSNGLKTVASIPKSTIAQGLAGIQSFAVPKEKVELPAGKYLLLSDIHIPYHAPIALELALQRGQAEGCNFVYLNGDTVDFYQLSKFEKDPGKRSVGEELIAARSFLEVLTQNFEKVWFKAGNHEARYDKYIRKNAPELIGVLPSLAETLGLADLGIEFVDSGQIAWMGKLAVFHGHEFPGGAFAPVNPARGLFLKTKGNAIEGHFHQPSHHGETNVSGSKIGAWSTGCLCDLSPDYYPTASLKWSHGFATVDVNKDGSFEVENYQIVDGKVKHA